MKKRSCIYILLCLSLIFAHAAVAQDADDKAYRKAYEYILRDPMNRQKTFVVSDSLIHLYKPMFWSYLKLENETDSVARLRVDSLHYAEKHVPTYMPLLRRLKDEKGGDSATDYIIYFSTIAADRTLIAEALPKVDGSWAYSANTIHNRGYIYLFVLDERQSIRRAIKRPMHYMHISTQEEMEKASDELRIEKRE